MNNVDKLIEILEWTDHDNGNISEAVICEYQFSKYFGRLGKFDFGNFLIQVAPGDDDSYYILTMV